MLFPEAYRKRLANEHLTAGRVLYLRCGFTNPRKEKYVVVAATEDPLLLLLVNSDVPEFINARPDLRDCQVTIKVEEHTFLKYDSFLDCTETFDSMTREEILGQLAADMSRIKGELSAAARRAAAEAIRRARTLSTAHKRRILAVLTSD